MAFEDFSRKAGPVLGLGRRIRILRQLRLVRVQTGALNVLFFTLNRRNTSC
jgi:hypothetical protein